MTPHRTQTGGMKRAIGPVVAIAGNDLRLMLRSRAAVFFTLVFPLLFALLFGLIFSGASSGGGGFALPIVVIDHDRTERSAAFVERLIEGEAVEVHADLEHDAAMDALRRGAVVAVIELEPGFGARLAAPFGATPSEAQVKMAVDPARQVERAAFSGVIAGAMYRQIADEFRPLLIEANETGGEGSNAVSSDMPIRIDVEEVSGHERTHINPFELTFPQGVAWGMIGCVTGFGLGLLDERRRGTLLRLAAGPMHRWQILAGKALGCFITACLVVALLFAVGALPVFGVRLAGPVQMVMVTASIAFAFVGIMMLVASLSPSQAGADGAARAVLLVLALMGGAGVPLMFFSPWLRAAASVSPFKWTIVALEGATFRGASPAELLMPCGVLVAMGAIGLGIGGGVFARWSMHGGDE